MFDDLDRGGVFFLELVEVFVAVFDFFVERLVLDFELLEVYEVQTLGELVFVLHLLLELGLVALLLEDVCAELLELGERGVPRWSSLLRGAPSLRFAGR